jgi:hypothetical protein
VNGVDLNVAMAIRCRIGCDMPQAVNDFALLTARGMGPIALGSLPDGGEMFTCRRCGARSIFAATGERLADAEDDALQARWRLNDLRRQKAAVADRGATEAEIDRLRNEAEHAEPMTPRARAAVDRLPDVVATLRRNRQHVTKTAVCAALGGVDRKTFNLWIDKGWITWPPAVSVSPQ